MSEVISTQAASNKCQQSVSHNRRLFKGLPVTFHSERLRLHTGKERESLHSECMTMHSIMAMPASVNKNVLDVYYDKDDDA